MTFEDVTLEVVTILKKFDIPYFFTEALAVVYYGEPRTTHDIDLVIQIGKGDVKKVIKGFEDDFFIDEVSVLRAIKEKSVFSAVHKDTGFKVDCWLLRDDVFDKSRFVRRTEVKILGTVICLPTA